MIGVYHPRQHRVRCIVLPCLVGMGAAPFHHPRSRSVECQLRCEARDEAVDLGVVENGAMGEVADQQVGPEPVRRNDREQFRGNMHQLGVNA